MTESENYSRLNFFNLNSILTYNILKTIIILFRENLHPGNFILKNTSQQKFKIFCTEHVEHNSSIESNYLHSTCKLMWKKLVFWFNLVFQMPT